MALFLRTTIIEPALRASTILAGGEQASDDEANDALSSLNAMVDSWASQSLMVFNIKRELFPITAGVATYTFGATGTWVNTGNDEIKQMSIMYANQTEIPVSILNPDQWQDLTSKDTTSGVPQSVYLEYSFPNKTLTFYPVPSEATQAVIYYRNAVKEFTSLDEEVSLPPGYREALIYNLAIRIALEYGKQLDPNATQLAINTMSMVKRSNQRMFYITSDPQLLALTAGTNSYNNRTNS